MKAPEYETQYFAGLEAECLTWLVACTFCRGLGIRVMRIAVTKVGSAPTKCLVHCGSRGVEKMWRARRSGRLTLLLVLHPLADEIRASDDAEISTLAAYQIHKRNAIQLLQVR